MPDENVKLEGENVIVEHKVSAEDVALNPDAGLVEGEVVEFPLTKEDAIVAGYDVPSAVEVTDVTPEQAI